MEQKNHSQPSERRHFAEKKDESDSLSDLIPENNVRMIGMMQYIAVSVNFYSLLNLSHDLNCTYFLLLIKMQQSVHANLKGDPWNRKTRNTRKKAFLRKVKFDFTFLNNLLTCFFIFRQ